MRIFWSEISTAFRNKDWKRKIGLQNFNVDAKYWTVQEVSNLVRWSYKTRFLLLNVQTFVERKNNWNRTRIGDLQKKKLCMVRIQLFFTSEKNRSNTRNEKLFLLLGCGFNKDRTFFQTSSWQYWSTNAQITMQPTKQVSTFARLGFSCLLVGKTKTKNPLFCEVIL